jgi:hypothetical protein
MGGETKKAKGGKKNRKLGRNVNYCKTYSLGGLEAKNQKRRMARAIRLFPENKSLISDFDRIFGPGSSKVVLANRTAAQIGRAAARAHRKKLREQYRKPKVVMEIPDHLAEGLAGIAGA